MAKFVHNFNDDTIMNGKTIVTGVIGADVHAVGNKILAYALEQAGFKVINLGVMVSQEEFIEAALETNADAILISSYTDTEKLTVMDCARNAMKQD